jgi:hypothetical protein
MSISFESLIEMRTHAGSVQGNPPLRTLQAALTLVAQAQLEQLPAGNYATRRTVVVDICGQWLDILRHSAGWLNKIA